MPARRMFTSMSCPRWRSAPSNTTILLQRVRPGHAARVLLARALPPESAPAGRRTLRSWRAPISFTSLQQPLVPLLAAPPAGTWSGIAAAGVSRRGEYLKMIGLVELDFAHQRQRFLKVRLRLAGKADDEVGGDADARLHAAQFLMMSRNRSRV